MGRRALCAQMVLVTLGCASCAPQHTGPDVWALSFRPPSEGVVKLEITTSKHASLEECRRAGVEWRTEHPESNSVVECRLNCRETSKHDTVCEQSEAVEP